MSRFQPRSKAPATSNVSPQNAIASSDPVLLNSTPTSRLTPHQPTSEAVSERATLLLIRRTLCSSLGDKGRSTPTSIHEQLPPLTSSNDVDFQLYAFLAIIIREFVQVWYAKITPDQIFVEEVVKVIAHCTRGMEQRLRKVDLEALVFDELPDLLEVHVQAYRVAHQSLYPEPSKTDPRQIYHSLCPLPALSPVPDGDIHAQEQAANEAAYRQLLVQGVLALLLPTEDLENDCLTALVGQIFSEMILGNVVGSKVSEPWLLWEAVMKVAELIQTKLPKTKARVRAERSNSDLLSVPLHVTGQRRGRSWGHSIKKMFWLILQYAFTIFMVIRSLIITIATSSSLPPRTIPFVKVTGSAVSPDAANPPNFTDPKMTPQYRTQPLKQPILNMKIWSCVSTLVDVDARMPWLSATISMLQWGAITGPGKIGDTDGMLDKILSSAIHRYVLDPTPLPMLLRFARAAVFPNNAPAPPRTIPSAAEALLIRQRCAQTILSLIPTKIQDIYFGSDVERRVREVEDVLNTFSDPYCNKHLIYGIIELVLVRLMPELAEKGVEELLAERLN